MGVTAWLYTEPSSSAPRLLRLGGEIDLYTAPVVREQLLAVPVTDDAIVDMSDVRFFGATAITLLLELRAHLNDGGHSLRLATVPGMVRRLLDLLDLIDLLPCSPATGQTVADHAGSRR